MQSVEKYTDIHSLEETREKKEKYWHTLPRREKRRESVNPQRETPKHTKSSHAPKISAATEEPTEKKQFQTHLQESP